MVGRRQSARRGSRARDAAPRRQRGRCRDRDADGAQSGRAAILRHRRRRLSRALCRRKISASPPSTAARPRRPRRRPTASSAPTASRCIISRRWSAAARSACPACCACWRWRIAATASCPGRACSQPAIKLARERLRRSRRQAQRRARARQALPASTARRARISISRRHAKADGHDPQESRARRDAAHDRETGRRCFLYRARSPPTSSRPRDRPGQSGRHDDRRSRRLPGERAAADLRRLSPVPALRHGTAELRRRRGAGAARPAAAFRSATIRPTRPRRVHLFAAGQPPRLCRSRPLSRRSGFRPRAGARHDRSRLSRAARQADRPAAFRRRHRRARRAAGTACR